MEALDQIIGAIEGLDEAAMSRASDRQKRLTKPEGSLGVLEELSVKLAGITGRLDPPLSKRAVVVMAGDHGVAAENVSAYPPEVTPQMVMNFAAGGAAINVLARLVGCDVVVVDVGVAADLPASDRVLDRKVRPGTANMAEGPAMSAGEAEQAIGVGVDIATDLASQGYGVIATGDMGIGNTAASAAIVATFTDTPVEQAVGRGTGVDDEGLRHKVSVIERALATNRPDPDEPLEVLAKVGGLEIAGITGLVLGAARAHVPVLVDGYISSAGALVAAKLAPSSVPFMIASHLSVEPGHRVALEALGLKPMLHMDMRLGEGTGAVLAMPVIEAAVRILNEMATFDEAGVSTQR